MITKILIIGNTSEKYHLGSCLVRSAKILNIECIECDLNWKNWAPSMYSTWGRIFFKLSKKRPLEWWSFNKKLVTKIKEHKPNLILVTGIFPLQETIFNLCQILASQLLII